MLHFLRTNSSLVTTVFPNSTTSRTAIVFLEIPSVITEYDMEPTLRILAISAIMLFAGAADSSEPEDNSARRTNLHRITLADGTWLWMDAPVWDHIEKPQAADVRIFLYPRDAVAIKQLPVWVAEFTSVNYVPGNECYYALVGVIKDRIFVFATWNGQYCTIERGSGKLLSRGVGDEELGKYTSLVPQKLFFILGRSTGSVRR